MNTNFQTFHQMGSAISDFVKQATGRDNVQNIDMDHVTVAQNHVYEEVDVSGQIVRFNAGEAGLAFEKLLVQINPVQDLHGYDHPWPAGGGNNKYPVLIGDDTFIDNAGAQHSNDNGVLVIETVEDSSSSGVYIPQTGKVRETINACEAPLTVSMDIIASAPGDVRIVFCGVQQIFSISTVKQRVSVTATSKTTINLNIYGIRNGAVLRVSDLQIESGSTATPYAPYSNICPITGWTMVNLYRAGQNLEDAQVFRFPFPSEAGVVYGGTLDVVSGELVVDRAGVDLGTLTWVKFNNTGSTYLQFFYLASGSFLSNCGANGALNVRPTNILCSHYEPRSRAGIYNGNGAGIDVESTGAVYIYDSDKVGLTAEQFKSSMSGVQLVYELAEPQTYHLTPQEVKTLLGQNNIWADTGDIEVKFTNLKELY